MNGTLLQKPSARRVIGMVVGIVIIGLGIALFKQSHLGNDSISALNMRLAELFGISLGVQNIAANLLMFAIEIWVGRQYIGLGTFVNGICIGFIVTAFYDPIAALFGPAASLPEQLLWVAAAVIVTALGASLYQTADLGIAPYDALALELRDHTPVLWLPCLHGRGLRAGLLDAGRPGRAGHADLRVLPGAGHPVFQRAFFGKSAAVSAAENLSIGSAPSRECGAGGPAAVREDAVGGLSQGGIANGGNGTLPKFSERQVHPPQSCMG